MCADNSIDSQKSQKIRGEKKTKKMGKHQKKKNQEKLRKFGEKKKHIPHTTHNITWKKSKEDGRWWLRLKEDKKRMKEVEKGGKTMKEDKEVEKGGKAMKEDKKDESGGKTMKGDEKE